MVMVKNEERASATLKLEIGYFGHPDGRSAGSALERLTVAFDQSSGTSVPPAGGLELVHIEIGSLRALFELGEKLLGIYEQRELLRQFVESLVVGLQTLTSASPIGVPGPIRALIGTLAGPVAKQKASHVKIDVHGDNTQVFIIERVDAQKVVHQIAPRQTRLYRAERDANATIRRPSVLKADQTCDATIVEAGGQRYARPEGLGGLLVPVGMDVTQEVRSGTVMKGRLRYSGPLPSVFEIDDGARA
jgi:hypothetical protein